MAAMYVHLPWSFDACIKVTYCAVGQNWTLYACKKKLSSTYLAVDVEPIQGQDLAQFIFSVQRCWAHHCSLV